MSKGIALITGASRGIGRGIALTLAEAGYTIAGTTQSIDENNTESGILEVKAKVEALGQKLLPIQGDVSIPADREHMLQATLDEFGRVDLLINNAGITSPGRVDILEATPENFRRVMDVNLEGPFFLTQLVAKQMIDQPPAEESCSPAVIFITSVSATTASPNRGDYSVSKAGLSMTAQTYAIRLAQHGINVYEIQPGIVKTDMTKAVIPQYEDMIKGDKLLNKRWGTPEDIGKATLALAEGNFSYATGSIFVIDGGMGVKRL